MKRIILLSFLLITTLFSLGQAPVNDNCSGAINLGTLPTPAACPSGVGASVNVIGTNINATSPTPYTTLLGCQTGGNQPGPALDVWYQFTASGNQVNINITPGTAPILASPVITLWTGSCGSLIGYNCDNNGTAGGNNSVTFQPVTPGQTYYIQVSGMNNTSSGNFNMSVNATNDCNNCLQTANLTVSPAPVNGTYPPGTTVNFCYHITAYTQVSANWLHAVIPTFGCGWDLTTLTSTPPTSCSGSGTWNWYNSWTSSANGSVWGPGFGFNYTTPADANPGNNFGDNCSTPNWNFCWSIKTKNNCVGCTNLNVSINTAGDGESGSWTSIACQGDPNYTFGAVMSCCTTTASSTNVTCFGGSNGSATATPGPSGVAPFTYSWNSTPVQTTQTATNLPAGNYTVTVTDFNGCISTATVSITQPTAINVITTQTNSTCGSPNGSATATPTGGLGPYNYLWSNGQTTQTSTSLLPGVYNVTVTGFGGCTGTSSATITTTGSITATASSNSVSCFGGNNGSATAIPTGGSSYTYLWSNGQTTNPATGLIAGVYTVTVISAGCTASATTTVNQPSAVTSTISMTPSTCSNPNGSANVVVSGGVGSYTYLWSNSQTTNPAINLIAGTYTVTIADANSCISTNTITVSNTGSPIVTIPTSTNVSCFGGSNGSATSNVIGGIGPYTYSWNTIPVQTTPNAINLTAGTYTLTVIGTNTCSSTATITITQPTQLTSVITKSNVSCFGGNNGSATSTPSGGVGPYTYSWNSIPIQITQTANNLVAGTYSCTSTDANGCQIVVSTNITQPPQLNLVVGSRTNISCFGGNNGSISVIATGGVGPNYLYSINSGPNQLSPSFGGLVAGNYTITVTDQNGCTSTVTTTLTQTTAVSATSTITNVTCFGSCNGQIQLTSSGGVAPYTYLWSNGQVINPVVGLCSGTYSCTVTDANGCQFTIINQVVSQPSNLTVSPNASPSIICIGQSSNLTSNASGGIAPYTYLWSDGSTLSNISVSPITATNYTVTITDANGCVTTSSTTVTVNPVLTINASSSPASICAGQNSTLSANAGGGNGGPYTFVWVPGGVGQTINVTPSSTTVYTVTVSDGCSPNVSTTVTVIVNTSPTISFSTTPLSGCEPLTVTYTNLTSGSANCVWNINGTIYNNCLVTQSFPVQGTYNSTLTVTDSNGCSATSPNIVVNVYPIPIAAFTANPEITDILNPSIVFNNTSSIGSYNWNFGDGSTSSSSYPTHVYGDTGTYQVNLIVTTTHGCINMAYGTVHISDIFLVYVPNAFTPNGDGHNDTFFPVVTGAEKFTFWIFDRWGEMIYQSDGGSPWDSTYKGKEVQQDVYVWKLSVIDKRKVKHEYAGHVTVIK